MNLQVLEDHGIDYQTGIERCMNDEEFYKQILLLFLKEDAFARGKQAWQKRDRKALFNQLHELKGSCGNAAIQELYETVVPLVELLRKDQGTEEEIAAMFQQIEYAYERARKGIQSATQN